VTDAPRYWRVIFKLGVWIVVEGRFGQPGLYTDRDLADRYAARLNASK
jgi:hypothetical protein